MKGIYFYILMSVWSVQMYAQNFELVHVDSLRGTIDMYSIDNFENLYTTNKDLIVKHNPKLDTLFSASLKTFVPNSIESSKSFRVLLFDRDRGIVNFFDNTLTDIKGEIDLSNLDILQAVLVCESFNGNSFWILDQGGQQLLKIDQNLSVISRQDNLGYLFEGRDSPVQMFEQNDALSIHFKHKGIAFFDVFGTFLKFSNFNSNWIDIKDNYLFSLKAEGVEVFELPLYDKINTFPLLDKTYDSFKVVNQKMYLKYSGGLDIYKISKMDE